MNSRTGHPLHTVSTNFLVQNFKLHIIPYVITIQVYYYFSTKVIIKFQCKILVFYAIIFPFSSDQKKRF